MEVPIYNAPEPTLTPVPMPVSTENAVSSQQLKKYNLYLLAVVIVFTLVSGISMISKAPLLLAGLIPSILISVVFNYFIAKTLKFQNVTWVKALFISLVSASIGATFSLLASLMAQFTPWNFSLGLLSLPVQLIAVFFAIRWVFKTTKRTAIKFMIYNFFAYLITIFLAASAFIPLMTGSGLK